MRVRREGMPSTDYLATLRNPALQRDIAIFTPNNPTQTQWFDRSVVHIEVIAQVYEYTEPRLGMTRWPTLSDSAYDLLFNIQEGDGGGDQVSTVDATIDVQASVDALPAVREVAIVERMDDGQWRIAGYGLSEAGQFKQLDLKITTSGTLYAIGMDDYGKIFVPGAPVLVGERVRPTAFGGWLYQVTQAGDLPTIEPEWWAADGENAARLVGTARLQAKRFYRPLAHGPIQAQLVETL